MSSGDRSSGTDSPRRRKDAEVGSCSAALRPHPSCAVDRFRAIYPMSSGAGSPARLCLTSGFITRRRGTAEKAGSRRSSEETSKRETAKTTLCIAAGSPRGFPSTPAEGRARRSLPRRPRKRRAGFSSSQIHDVKNRLPPNSRRFNYRNKEGTCQPKNRSHLI